MVTTGKKRTSCGRISIDMKADILTEIEKDSVQFEKHPEMRPRSLDMARCIHSRLVEKYISSGKPVAFPRSTTIRSMLSAHRTSDDLASGYKVKLPGSRKAILATAPKAKAAKAETTRQTMRALAKGAGLVEAADVVVDEDAVPVRDLVPGDAFQLQEFPSLLFVLPGELKEIDGVVSRPCYTQDQGPQWIGIDVRVAPVPRDEIQALEAKPIAPAFLPEDKFFSTFVEGDPGSEEGPAMHASESDAIRTGLELAKHYGTEVYIMRSMACLKRSGPGGSRPFVLVEPEQDE